MKYGEALPGNNRILLLLGLHDELYVGGASKYREHSK